MKNIVFAIVEEENSNGKLIAEKLSKELNIPLYDKDIITLASKNSNINENIFYTIENWKLNKIISPFPTDFCLGFNIAFLADFIPIQDKVFIEKSKAIRQLSKDKSCIIFSKCSNYILKDYKNCLSVLIYARDDDRINNFTQNSKYSIKERKKYLRKKDKLLYSHYGYYTCENWDNKKCYDIFLNSSTLGIKNCVSILKTLFFNIQN